MKTKRPAQKTLWRTLLSVPLILLATPAQEQNPNGLLLVSYSGEASVGLLNPVTGELAANLLSGRGPHEITVSRDGATAYVAISGTGPQGEPGHTITVVDVKKRTVKANFELTGCRQPHDTRLSRDGALLWVACGPAQAVLELDARTGEQRRVLKTNVDGGWFVEVTPDERKLYVPHLEGKALTVIDRANGTARAVYSGTTQFGIAISPDGREVWVSDSDKYQLTIVETASDQVRGHVSFGPPREGQPGFARLRFTPGGQHVVVVLGAKLTVVDARRRAIAWTVDLPYAGKVVAISDDGRHAAVSHPSEDRVSVVDLTKRNVTATFAVGRQPDGVAWVR